MKRNFLGKEEKPLKAEETGCEKAPCGGARQSVGDTMAGQK